MLIALALAIGTVVTFAADQIFNYRCRTCNMVTSYAKFPPAVVPKCPKDGAWMTRIK